jgi:hypothetical protein
LFVEPLEDRTVPSLLAPVSYPVGSGAWAVAVGDFTGTGIPDLVVANDQSNTVSVLLGKGDGTFQPTQNYAVGGTPVSVAVGDFNHDGKHDIVTANMSGSVSVLLGNGDGTFQPALNYCLPGQSTGAETPVSVAVGDFNKDGKLDVAVGAWTYTPGTPGTPGTPVYAGYYGGGYSPGTPGTPGHYNGYVNVLIGNGVGGFSTAHSYALPATSTDPRSIAVGDFNGDGHLDLAVADHSSSTVSVLLGNGNGTFGNPTTLATGPQPWEVAVGDFNGDGKLDLVTANAENDTVSVFLGRGNGTFAPAVNYSVDTAPGSVAVADVNRDGKPDIVTANDGGSSVSVLLGNGDGTFQTAQNFAAGSLSCGVAVGDFNRDGWPDVAVTNELTGTGTVSVLLNAADGSASPQASSFAVSGFPSPTAGAPGSFTVTAKMADGTTDTNYTGTVHFTSSDSEAVLPADYTFTAADAGVHTFSATFRTAGTQSITATDTAPTKITGTDAGIIASPAAASKLIIIAPSSVTAGTRFSLTVKVEDAYGNVVTGYIGTVRFSSTDGTATLPKYYTFTAADKGVHTFTGLVLRKKGKQTIAITDTLLSSLGDSVTENVL